MVLIGDLVMCMCEYEDWYTDGGDKINVPKLGEIYTIREIQHISNKVKAVRFDEITNIKIDSGDGRMIEPCFECGCFDKIPEADLKELKQLLK